MISININEPTRMGIMNIWTQSWLPPDQTLSNATHVPIEEPDMVRDE